MRSQPTAIQILPLEEEHYSGILTVAEDLPEWDVQKRFGFQSRLNRKKA